MFIIPSFKQNQILALWPPFLLFIGYVIFKYLELLFNIIDNWQEKYIDTKIIDGDYWKLSITYIDDSKKEFYGKSNYPTNFEAFERLNQNLIYGESKWII